MISAHEAEQCILSHIKPLETVVISIHDAENTVLCENCYADRPYPPFHRACMDGIAISSKHSQASWQIQSLQKAGDEPHTLQSNQHAIEIMTGAVLPHGCDTIIRYEDLRLENDQAKLQETVTLSPFTFVHKQGSDCREGALVIAAGSTLTAPMIGALASLGKNSLLTHRPVKIAVISTGDELVAIEQSPNPQQIRRSNPYAIKFALKKHGVRDVTLYEAPDALAPMLKIFSEALETHDALIISGGVSAGKFDWVPQTLTELGVQKIFHKVRQKPGKPLWFGMSSRGQAVFGLPGNPQSSLICFYRYLSRAIAKMMGRTPKPVYASLKAGPRPQLVRDLTHFLPVYVSFDSQATISAELIPHQGSGDFIALAKGDGFIESPENDDLQNNKTYPLYFW